MFYRSLKNYQFNIKIFDTSFLNKILNENKIGKLEKCLKKTKKLPTAAIKNEV